MLPAPNYRLCRSVHRGAYFAELRTTTVRKLLPESWGFLCPVHTPDGSPCGLLNHFSAACSIITEGPSEPQAREVGLVQVSNAAWAGPKWVAAMVLLLVGGVRVRVLWCARCARLVVVGVCACTTQCVKLGDDSSYCLRGHLLSTSC